MLDITKRRNRPFRCLGLLLSLLLLQLALTSGPQAATIVLTNVGGASPGSAAGIAYRRAADFWERILEDNVTIRIDVEFAPILLADGVTPSSARGKANSPDVLMFYTPVPAFPSGQASSVAVALTADIDSADDASAVAGLQGGFALDFVVNTATDIVFDGNPLELTEENVFITAGGGNNLILTAPQANTKALGLVTDANGFVIDTGPADSDGTVTLNSALVEISGQPAWDFEPSDGIDPLAVDFVHVAIHEIGHILGFVSGVELIEALVLGDPEDRLGPVCEQSMDGEFGTLNICPHITVLDLFRFSDLSLGQDPMPIFSCPDCGPGVLDEAVGGDPFFSVDAGVTRLDGFSTGALAAGGDGKCPSHWVQQLPRVGVMTPTLSRGERGVMTVADLRAMDVIGWEVPEPTGALPLGAMLLLSLARRRQSQLLIRRNGDQ